MFHFSLFKIKSFLGGNIAILLNSIARGDFIFLISLYQQGAFMNLSSVQTPIYLIPVSELLFIVLLLRSLLLVILFLKILLS